ISLFRRRRDKAKGRCRNVAGGINSVDYWVRSELNVGDDVLRTGFGGISLGLGDLNHVAAGVGSGKEASIFILDKDKRFGIAVVLGQQLVEAIGILTAFGILASRGNFLGGGIRGWPASHNRGLFVQDGDSEAAGIGIPGTVHSRTGDGGHANRED